jgi:hypothetical protein
MEKPNIMFLYDWLYVAFAGTLAHPFLLSDIRQVRAVEISMAQPFSDLKLVK